MNIINFNGKNITVSGNNVCIQNGKVFVDGKEVLDGVTEGTLEIKVEGDLSSLKVDRGEVRIEGNVKGDVDAGNGVNCRDVGGNVDAGNGVHCGNVLGSVRAGNSVHCGSIKGDVRAGGNVMRL